jgi:hypothetical protein
VGVCRSGDLARDSVSLDALIGATHTRVRRLGATPRRASHARKHAPCDAAMTGTRIIVTQSVRRTTRSQRHRAHSHVVVHQRAGQTGRDGFRSTSAAATSTLV